MEDDGIIYRNILENMSDGVMTIARDGRILTFNEAAEKILGLRKEEVAGRLFGEVFLAGEGRDDFCQAVLGAIYDSALTHNRTVPYQTCDRTRTLSVTTSFLRGDGEEKRNTAVIVVLSDRTEIEALRHEEQRLIEERRTRQEDLQKSCLDLEDANVHLRSALQKMHKIRMAATALVILLFLVIGLATWTRLHPARVGDTSTRKNRGGSPATFTVEPRNLTDSLSIKGTLKPIRVVSVTSPFSGTVREKRFEYGEPVVKGQVLLVMDTTEAEEKHRDARAAFIKAGEKYRQVNDWKSSDDMVKTARSLARARRSLLETEALFKKGIVSANEYEDQKNNYENELQTYRATQARGEGQNITLAKLEYDNAKARLADLSSQLNRAIVRAPVSGTVIRGGPADKDKQEKTVERGAAFSQGETLVSVGDTSGLSVRVSVDEMEISKIQKGQEVMITGQAYPGVTLRGTVNYVSTQAVVRPGDGEGSRTATFDIGIAVATLPPEAAAMVRLGMTSNLSILILNKPDALLVPFAAVRTRGGDRVLTVLDKGTGESRTVKVETGITTTDSVEILRGLKPGDVVVLDGPGG